MKGRLGERKRDCSPTCRAQEAEERGTERRESSVGKGWGVGGGEPRGVGCCRRGWRRHSGGGEEERGEGWGDGWLVEDLQAAHGQPHVSRERLVHGGVVQGQENRHVGLQLREGRGEGVMGEEVERRRGRREGRDVRGARVILKTTNPLSCQTESLGQSQSQRETGRQIAGNATEQPAGGDGGGLRRTAGNRNKKGGKKKAAARWLQEAACDLLCAVIIILDSHPTVLKLRQQVFVISPHGVG